MSKLNKKSLIMPSWALLAILYLCFISLGLPDSLLGVAWPQMRVEFDAPLSLAGAIAVFTSIFSTMAGFFSGRILARFGTRTVTIASCFLTTTGILIYSVLPSAYLLFPVALILGIGAGSVDAGLNHFVAEHYSSRHMSWLHCCWGVGATLGPLIFTAAGGGMWRQGYLAVGLIQLSIGIFLILTMKVWVLCAPEKPADIDTAAEKIDSVNTVSPLKLFFTKRALLSSGSFFFYGAGEFGVGLWLTSFLVESRGLSAEAAGYYTSVYWGGLMISRFLMGILADKLGNKRMINFGLIVGAAGLLILLAGQNWGLVLTGAGLAPVYPCMMHAARQRFRAEEALHIIGFQSGMAMAGCSLPPALMGLVFQRYTMASMPVILMVALAITLLMQIYLNKLLGNR